MSKGSTRRPRQVSRDEYDERWARTFGRRGYAQELSRRAPVTKHQRDEIRDTYETRIDFSAVPGMPQADGFPE